jgi:hypothetical protein
VADSDQVNRLSVNLDLDRMAEAFDVLDHLPILAQQVDETKASGSALR